MKHLQLPKGFNFALQGRPEEEIDILGRPDRVGLLPEQIAFVKPRLLVRPGDPVRIGSPLIEDKRNPAIKFPSPGGGRVAEINFGPRRVIKEVVIELDEQEDAVTFDALTADQLDQIDRQDLVQRIIDSGLWALLRRLPYRDVAPVDRTPPAILVNLDNKQPFMPAPSLYLEGRTDLFEYGLAVLNKLAQGRVFVGTAASQGALLESLRELVTHVYTGAYPADDPGVLVYRTKRKPADNHAWYIQGQDLLMLAHLLKTGQYATRRVYALGGACVSRPMHLGARLGAPLAQLMDGRLDSGYAGDRRCIQGGVLTGFATPPSSYMGLFETALTLVPEGNVKGAFLGFVRPGFDRPTYSRTFLSRLNRSNLKMDCNKNGGDRACIACFACADVCPVDILVHFTYKAVLADEIEDALRHGLLDCVECGLCSYVCPSKIELMETLKQARAELQKEQI